MPRLRVATTEDGDAGPFLMGGNATWLASAVHAPLSLLAHAHHNTMPTLLHRAQAHALPLYAEQQQHAVNSMQTRPTPAPNRIAASNIWPAGSSAAQKLV